MDKRTNAVRKLKRSGGWVGIIVFSVLGMLALALLGTFVFQLLDYIVTSKLEAEAKEIAYMSRVYDASGEDSYDILDYEGRKYIVRDNDGVTVYGSEEDSCDVEALDQSLSDDGMTCYQDTKTPGLFVSDAGKLHPDPVVMGQLLSTGSSAVSLVVDEDLSGDDLSLMGGMETMLHRSLSLPLWMGYKVQGGTREFIGQAHLVMGMGDMIILLSFEIITAFFAIVMLVVIISSVIRGIAGQRRTMHLFFTDQVTGGSNWMWFLYRGEHILRSRKAAKDRYAVVDLIFLKYRNYCVCHSLKAGEEVLKKMYDIVSRHLNRQEICAHGSTAHFAILMKANDREEVKMRLEDIIREASKADPDHMFSLQAGVSVMDMARDKKGRIIPRKAPDLESEYNNASAARFSLDVTDQSGVAFFDEKMVEEQRWEDWVQETQRHALDNEEFVVYYQPKYDPRNDVLRGAEALIRWNSEKYGMVPPGKFIPIFEKNGFITEIDHYMIRHVAADQRRWLDQGRTCVPVSVNVSRAHFIEEDLAEQIRDMVDASGTPRHLIEIELTESAFFDDKKAIIKTIEKLKEYGFATSMDDFGSGYSSLNSLKDMPLDVLKLDAEFFRGESDDERRRIVVSETIRLAKSLHMKTVAEGVEVKNQVEFLAGQGCDMIQGYIYAKPMPGDEYKDRMKVREE